MINTLCIFMIYKRKVSQCRLLDILVKFVSGNVTVYVTGLHLNYIHRICRVLLVTKTDTFDKTICLLNTFSVTIHIFLPKVSWLCTGCLSCLSSCHVNTVSPPVQLLTVNMIHHHMKLVTWCILRWICWMLYDFFLLSSCLTGVFLLIFHVRDHLNWPNICPWHKTSNEIVVLLHKHLHL